MNLHDT